MSRQVCKIAFVWDQCCDYHMDRVEALTAAMDGEGRVILFEIANRSRTYDWPECRSSELVERVTLFPGEFAEEVSEFAAAVALLRAHRKHKITNLFVTGYEHPGRFFTSLILRLVGGRPTLVIDSKFDDKQRRLRLELIKRMMLLPYRSALVSGRRSANYVRFLGMRNRKIATGCDTVSLDRMRSLAPAVDPVWSDRPFLIVARLVKKKNIITAMRAFAALGSTRRQLRICGDGPLRDQLETEARKLGIADRVVMLGSVSQEEVAREMAGALCLLLPSVEEQWGLVVNEALAFALPVIASDNVGAKDLLIANLVNGFLLDPRDLEGWTRAMQALDTDKALWERFVEGSKARQADADVGHFVRSVQELIAD